MLTLRFICRWGWSCPSLHALERETLGRLEKAERLLRLTQEREAKKTFDASVFVDLDEKPQLRNGTHREVALSSERPVLNSTERDGVFNGR